MSIVGARPNFMKAAPIIAAIRAHNARVAQLTDSNHGQVKPAALHHVLVHTGQHYDKAMSDSFFADLGIPEPDYNLGVGSGSHAAQTAEIMRKFEEALLREQPDVLVVVGDVNSTLACALVAAKISYDDSGRRPLIAHVEAGLRSFDRTMPEEINRLLTDQLSDLLFTTEESANENLRREGVPSDKVHFVGNTMIDSLLAQKSRSEASTILPQLGLRRGGYVVLTLHRPANVDNCEPLVRILAGLDELAAERPIVFPAHPRTQKRIREFGLQDRFLWDGAGTHSESVAGIRITAPLRYPDFVSLMENSALVITDSGGMQEETACLGVPCVTVRENTERPVTIQVGANVLAGVETEGIRQAIRRQTQERGRPSVPEKWDGKSAERILEILSRTVSESGNASLATSGSAESDRAYVRS